MWHPEGVEKEKGDVARKKRGKHIRQTVAGLWLTKNKERIKERGIKKE